MSLETENVTPQHPRTYHEPGHANSHAFVKPVQFANYTPAGNAPASKPAASAPAQEKKPQAPPAANPPSATAQPSAPQAAASQPVARGGSFLHYVKTKKWVYAKEYGLPTAQHQYK